MKLKIANFWVNWHHLALLLWIILPAIGNSALLAVSEIWLKNKSAVPSEAGVGYRTIKTSKHSIENFCTVDLNEIAGPGPEGREWLSGHTMPV